MAFVVSELLVQGTLHEIFRCKNFILLNGKRICGWSGNCGVRGAKEQAQNQRVNNKREVPSFFVSPKKQHRSTFYGNHDGMSTARSASEGCGLPASVHLMDRPVATVNN